MPTRNLPRGYQGWSARRQSSYWRQRRERRQNGRASSSSSSSTRTVRDPNAARINAAADYEFGDVERELANEERRAPAHQDAVRRAFTAHDERVAKLQGAASTGWAQAQTATAKNATEAQGSAKAGTEGNIAHARDAAAIRGANPDVANAIQSLEGESQGARAKDSAVSAEALQAIGIADLNDLGRKRAVASRQGVERELQAVDYGKKVSEQKRDLARKKGQYKSKLLGEILEEERKNATALAIAGDRTEIDRLRIEAQREDSRRDARTTLDVNEQDNATTLQTNADDNATSTGNNIRTTNTARENNIRTNANRGTRGQRDRNGLTAADRRRAGAGADRIRTRARAHSGLDRLGWQETLERIKQAYRGISEAEAIAITDTIQNGRVHPSRRSLLEGDGLFVDFGYVPQSLFQNAAQRRRSARRRRGRR